MKSFKNFIAEAKLKSKIIKKKSSFLDKALTASLMLAAGSTTLAMAKAFHNRNAQTRPNIVSVSPSSQISNRVINQPVQKTIQSSPQKKSYAHDEIKKMVVSDEGLRLKPYKDTRGILTVGVGHNLQASASESAFTRAFGSNGSTLRNSIMRGNSLNKDQAMKLFDADYDEHLNRTVKLFPNLHKYPSDVQSVLVSGVYRGHVSDSPKFIKHFNSGNYEEATKEFLNRKEYTNPQKTKSGELVAPGVKTRLERDHSILTKYTKSLGK